MGLDIAILLLVTAHPSCPLSLLAGLSPLHVLCLPCRLLDYDRTGLLASYPLPFDAVAEPQGGHLPAAGRGAKTPARGKAPRGGRRQAAVESSESGADSDGGPQMPASSDDEEEEEGAEHTPARVPATASRRQPDRGARSARKPLAEASSPSDSSEGDSEGSEEEEEGEDGVSPLAENSPAVVRPPKARRCSSDSVSALRHALQENRIS